MPREGALAPSTRDPPCRWGGPRGPGQAQGRLLLGHLRDVLVAQRYPEVVVLVQEHLLHPRLPNAARLVPGQETGDVPRDSPNPLVYNRLTITRMTAQQALRPSEVSLSVSGLLHLTRLMVSCLFFFFATPHILWDLGSPTRVEPRPSSVRGMES